MTLLPNKLFTFKDQIIYIHIFIPSASYFISGEGWFLQQNREGCLASHYFSVFLQDTNEEPELKILLYKIYAN